MPSKRSKFTGPEIEYIKRNYPAMNAQELAQNLRRAQDQVELWIQANIVTTETFHEATVKDDKEITSLTIQNRLRRSPEWSQMKKEFKEDELKFIEHRFARVCAQFKSDITVTEETQILFMIKIEMLMNANMSSRKDADASCSQLSSEISNLHQMYPVLAEMPKDQKELLQALQNRFVAINTTQTARINEYSRLLEKHQSLMKDLKGTREQRITKIEDDKLNYINIIKSLQSEEIKEAEGKHAEIMKILAKTELNRLGEYHTYQDQSVDKPILTAETVE